MSDVVCEMLCVGGASEGCSKQSAAHCHANAAHQAPVPSRRQGVHPTPWQAASAAHSTQMLPVTQSAGAQPTPGRTSDPLASSKRRTQHANATGRAPVPSRRQGVHPTPWQAASAAHSTQRLYRKVPSAGAHPTPGRTSDPLASSYKVASSQLPAPQMLCLPRNLHMEFHTALRLPRNLHMEVHKVLRLPRNLHMEVHKALRLPRNPHL